MVGMVGMVGDWDWSQMVDGRCDSSAVTQMSPIWGSVTDPQTLRAQSTDPQTLRPLSSDVRTTGLQVAAAFIGVGAWGAWCGVGVDVCCMLNVGRSWDRKMKKLECGFSLALSLSRSLRSLSSPSPQCHPFSAWNEMIQSELTYALQRQHSKACEQQVNDKKKNPKPLKTHLSVCPIDEYWTKIASILWSFYGFDFRTKLFNSFFRNSFLGRNSYPKVGINFGKRGSFWCVICMGKWDKKLYKSNNFNAPETTSKMTLLLKTLPPKCFTIYPNTGRNPTAYSVIMGASRNHINAYKNIFYAFWCFTIWALFDRGYPLSKSFKNINA
jgi:hypothetical protein